MLFCQLDYPEELGTKDPNDPQAPTVTIAEDGCAETAFTSMLVNVFGEDVDPTSVNEDLSANGAYASNADGDFDLFDWVKAAEIFGLTFNFNHTYYNAPSGNGTPANMDEIDALLAEGYSVIVGVSFNHNPKEPTPTHYVEIYRKNDDKTYQMRDPMFHADECDTVFNTRYAVNGMSVPNAILQVVSYIGDLPEEVASKPAIAQYNIGDTVKVYSAVPTGKSPDAISFTYGQVSPTAPAKVIGYDQYNGDWYYNLDQAMIGGGTGYARVEDIDKASNPPAAPVNTPVPPVTAANISTSDTQPTTEVESQTTIGSTIPDPTVASDNLADPIPAAAITPLTTSTSQVQQLTVEKGDLTIRLDEMQQKYNNDLARYQEMVAAGYEKVEDIVNKIGDFEKIITGLKKHVLQVVTNNGILHKMLAAHDTADSTAIEEGIKYQYLYKDLQSDMSSIAKIFKTRPYMKDILSAADKIKAAYDKVIEQLKKKNIKDAARVANEIGDTVTNTDDGEENSIGFLDRILSFEWMK